MPIEGEAEEYVNSVMPLYSLMDAESLRALMIKCYLAHAAKSGAEVEGWTYCKDGIPSLNGHYLAAVQSKNTGNVIVDELYFGHNGRWWNTSDSGHPPVDSIEVYAWRPIEAIDPPPLP